MMYGGDGWMWNGGGWGWPGWLLMTLVMVLFWAGVITAVVLAVRFLAGGGSRQHVGGDGHTPALHRAQDVLVDRYARGEIDDDEFRRRLSLLREHQ